MTTSDIDISIAASLAGLPADSVVVIPQFADDDLSDIEHLEGLSLDRARIATERGTLRGIQYESLLFPSESGQPGLLLVGAGERDEIEPVILSRIYAAGARTGTHYGFSSLVAVDRSVLTPQQFARCAVEGALLGPHEAGLRKTRPSSRAPLSSVVLATAREVPGDVIEQAQAVGEAVNLARDLVNAPPNDLTPSILAERAETAAAESGLRFDVLDEERVRQLGMGSLLGVAQGSVEAPRVIVLRYGPDDSALRLALVGKGLTFDSGGLSLKTAEGMETMKGDMGGGAAVIAAMTAVARIAPRNISVIGIVGATENMPSGSAMRPGDVLTAMTGETIEVLNTDAEGRLVLADVLAYAVELGATHIVDVATLTGSAAVALGKAAFLVTGQPRNWVDRVVHAANDGLERGWPMPLYEEYRRAMDSEVADIKNTGGRYGGALNAAAFLSDFVSRVPWAHLDIAGTSWADKPAPYGPSGGTGSGVGTLVALAVGMAQEDGSP